jgi:hypothetical protein
MLNILILFVYELKYEIKKKKKKNKLIENQNNINRKIEEKKTFFSIKHYLVSM